MWRKPYQFSSQRLLEGSEMGNRFTKLKPKEKSGPTKAALLFALTHTDYI